MNNINNIDVIVIGGGHAGIEAAHASAKMGLNTKLFTLNKKKLASTPCNPSIGGPAKGVVVKEIDALGGLMGKITDESLLQIKMLNTSKGPGVRCLRAQIDKIKYSKKALDIIENTPNLEIIQEEVDSLIIKKGECKGVNTNHNSYLSKSVIITTGTFLRSKVLIGNETFDRGPENEKNSKNLIEDLISYGFETLRLKTGTPPRLLKDTINYSNMILQPGDDLNLSFSIENEDKKIIEKNAQAMCYLIHTNDFTKKIIMDDLNLSPMYSGNVESVGPRYCPSIEDKIVRFSDKSRHQLFLEPESKKMDTIYLQGFSTSMPKKIQEKMVKSLPGLKNAVIKDYAYAIEYDAINPTQLWPTLESKKIKNLFFAGQINGSSGYEEAAGQGIIAGINASAKIKKMPPIILKRDESYIGVMIDDLVTKGTKEPYRLLTSRAEYRLLIRNDNADLRLMEYSFFYNLASKQRKEKFLEKKQEINKLKKILKDTSIILKDDLNKILEKRNISPLNQSIPAYDFLKRPNAKINFVLDLLSINSNYNQSLLNQVETQIKYEGYIKKQIKLAKSNEKLESILLPSSLDFFKIDNLALEARQKLDKIKPLNLGQTSRISGVNPSDINNILIFLKKRKNSNG